jgi:predicted component of type VI protein secretion system
MDPLRVRVEDLDDHTVESFAFLRSPVRVGRGELNDLRLERPYVSTWHGVVQFDDDGVRYVDLGSTNGSTLDGARLERNAPTPVGPAAELVIGRLRISLSRGAAEGRAAPPAPVTMFARRVAQGTEAAERAAIEAAAALATPAAEPSPREPSIFDAGPAAPVIVPLAPALDAPPDPAVEAALEGASWQLGVLHDACRQADESFRMALDQILTPLSEPQKRQARALVAARYPSAAAPAGEPAAAVPAPGPAVPAVAAGEGGALQGDALRLVRAFAEAYLSVDAVPATPAALERFLGGLAEALETAARGYLELRGGYEQFGREMGIRVPKGEGAIARLGEPRALLGWLLQPTDGEPRAPQLGSAFADLMIHQVALLNGVQAGARALLEEISPDAIAGREGRGALGLKPLREAALWRAFVERHQGLHGEESAITDVLFGKAFARAYAAVAGRRAPGEDSDARGGAVPRKS